MEEDAMPARFPRRPGLTLVGAVALVIAIANPAAAPPGDLDPTFDGDGKVTTDFAGIFEIAGAVAIQGDGKIVAAGTAADVSGISDFALARYNTDGSLDPTFDGDGKVTTDFAGASDEANAISIQGDGKIVAAGVARIGLNGPQDFALARYNTDGSLDTAFDGDGKVTTDFAGANDQAHAVAIQGDGKIVAAGVAGDVISGTNDFGLARYNANGSLDTTFGGDLPLPVPGDGKVTTDFAGPTDQAFGVAIQGDGKIVAAGLSGSDFALARYNSDGSLDTAFDGDGKVTTDFAGPTDQAHAVAIQGDGKIVAAGFAGSDFDFALARYNTDGSLDTTFGGDGKVTTDFAGSGSRDEAHAVAIQGDGKIVAAGLAVVSGIFDFALARYRADGSLDTIFSGDGKVTTDFAGDFDVANGVVIQANGRIVAAGFAGDDFALARYTCVRRTSRPSSIPLCP
jgi:uncharacterized delta-60 repeat protein